MGGENCILWEVWSRSGASNSNIFLAVLQEKKGTIFSAARIAPFWHIALVLLWLLVATLLWPKFSHHHSPLFNLFLAINCDTQLPPRLVSKKSLSYSILCCADFNFYIHTSIMLSFDIEMTWEKFISKNKVSVGFFEASKSHFVSFLFFQKYTQKISCAKMIFCNLMFRQTFRILSILRKDGINHLCCWEFYFDTF